MGFFSSIKNLFKNKSADNLASAESQVQADQIQADLASDHSYLETEEAKALILELRKAEPKLSQWLAIILQDISKVEPIFWQRLELLLYALDAPLNERQKFIADFASWLKAMDYTELADFRSELQYRLALALELEDEEDERDILLAKLSKGLEKTRQQLGRSLGALLGASSSLDEQFWEELEEILILADMGVSATQTLITKIKEQQPKERSQVQAILVQEIAAIFQRPREITAINAPEVILFLGVNGAGKTTSIAKLAHRAKMQGKKVLIAAADTFRAAAVEQIKVWAERIGVAIHVKETSDPAAVAYTAIEKAVNENFDLLLIDTAGRLQTKTNLMAELAKIRNVIGKKHPGAPHRVILTLDATNGQNALSQAKLFREQAGANELILTKIDGTAKGGVIIAIALQEHLPITYLGLGEGLDDLRPFNAEDFAKSLLNF